MADAGARRRRSARRSTSRAISAIRCSAARCSGAAASRATTRSPGAMRAAPIALGVDIIQNCEVTAIRRDASGAVALVETTRGEIRAKKVGVVAAGHTSVIMAMAGLRMPLESYPLQALVSGAGEAGVPLRRDVEHDPRLYQPVRQGRAGHRRRHRRLYVLQPARRPAHHDAHARGDLRAVPDVPAHAHAAQLGRHRRRDAGPLADHRQDAGARASMSIAAGAPAASRRRPARATSSPTPSRTTGRIRSTHRSRWSASATAC